MQHNGVFSAMCTSLIPQKEAENISHKLKPIHFANRFVRAREITA